MRTYLRPTAPIARQALLPGDPKRAMELATVLTEGPVMSNLSRGLWGYHGRAADGTELTIQSTGIGGPSAAVVVAELAALGVRSAIRIGACTALEPELELGAMIVVTAAIPADGVGSVLATDAVVPADEALTAALITATAPAAVAPVATTDFHQNGNSVHAGMWREAGAVGLDLSSAAVLAVGRRHGVATAALLTVAESAAGERLGDDELDAALLDSGRRAAAALNPAQSSAEVS